MFVTPIEETGKRQERDLSLSPLEVEAFLILFRCYSVLGFYRCTVFIMLFL